LGTRDKREKKKIFRREMRDISVGGVGVGRKGVKSLARCWIKPVYARKMGIYEGRTARIKKRGMDLVDGQKKVLLPDA